MKFSYNMPCEIIFGKGCVSENAHKFANYNNIFIVTDNAAAKLSGALYDILNILNRSKSNFLIFDKITENPLLSDCFEAGMLAAEFGADLIVGIGGGSPLDAAKAVASVAANPQIAPDELFAPPHKSDPLPIFAIPTTAGTGSEANPYAILTLDGQDLKKTFNYYKSYAQVSFLDPEYTRSMPYGVTVSTALDALCHCIESWLSPKSTPLSAIYAELGIKKVYKNLELLAEESIVGDDVPIIKNNIKSDLRAVEDASPYRNDIPMQMREDFMLGSLCGGIAINTTGTGFPHPMGYNLTLINGLPHGKACAVFICEYLKMSEQAAPPAIIKDMLSAFDAPLEKICETITALTDYNIKFDDDTLRFYVKKISGVKNYTNSYMQITDDLALEIYKKCVGR